MRMDLMILIHIPTRVTRMTGVTYMTSVVGRSGVADGVLCFSESGVGVCLGHGLAVRGVGVIAAVDCSFCGRWCGGGCAGGTVGSLVVIVVVCVVRHDQALPGHLRAGMFWSLQRSYIKRCKF